MKLPHVLKTFNLTIDCYEQILEDACDRAMNRMEKLHARQMKLFQGIVVPAIGPAETIRPAILKEVGILKQHDSLKYFVSHNPKDSVQHLSPISELLRLIVSRKGKRGRPATKRPIAFQALEMKLKNSGFSWMKIAIRICECGGPHDFKCRENIRREVIELKKILVKHRILPIQ